MHFKSQILGESLKAKDISGSDLNSNTDNDKRLLTEKLTSSDFLSTHAQGHTNMASSGFSKLPKDQSPSATSEQDLKDLISALAASQAKPLSILKLNETDAPDEKQGNNKDKNGARSSDVSDAPENPSPAV